MELLEPRQHLSVTATVDSMTVLPTEWLIAMHYRSDTQIDLSSLGSGDIVATSPAKTTPIAMPAYSELGRPWQPPQVQQDGSVVQVYTVLARQQAWDWADNGTYHIDVQANEVRDTSGAGAPAGTAASYWLWFTTPRAEISLSLAAGSGWQYAVTYSDDVALDVSTIGTGNTELYGPNGLIASGTFQHLSDLGHGQFKAYYTAKIAQISASYLNTGTYDIVTRGAQVFDTSGHSVPAFGLGQYWYWSDAPAAQLVSSVVNGANSWTVKMRYSSPYGIDTSSIGHLAGDVRALQLGQPSTPQLGTIFGAPVVAADGSVMATYTILAPSGGWLPYDGSYSLNFFGTGHVADQHGHNITGGYIIQMPDWSLSSPTANVQSNTRVNASAWDVTVRITDDVSLNYWSVLNDAVMEVSSLSGFHAMLSMQSYVQQGGAWVVTYRLHSESGPLAAGHYYLRNVPQGVWDNAGHSMPSQELLAFDL
jgi:hypothetical protein